MIAMKVGCFATFLLAAQVATPDLSPKLFTFDEPEAAAQWQTVNDGVMGGRSEGRFKINDAGHLEFYGTLSLENNGGFASVRSRAKPLELQAGDAIAVRVRGDGRQYSLNLYVPTQQMAFSYRAFFDTKKDEWIDIQIPLSKFQATSFGRVVNQQLNPPEVNSFGFLLGDKQAGPFRLEVASIHVAAKTTETAAQPGASEDPLPSWNEGPAKAAVLEFVQQVTSPEAPGFVPVSERIATFDNDGTLWTEQPAYFQALFALDRVKMLAADHPEWKTTEPFKSALAGDMAGLLATGEKGVLELIMATHAGLTEDAFRQSVRDWLETAKHPRTGQPFTKMVFQPMLELLDYLRAHDFKIFIVSGGGIDFVRVFSEEVYGIPPERVVGSSLAATLEMRDGIPVVVKIPELDLIDDKAGKPVGIHRYIGRRPIFAAGNSDGDLQMLQYTTIPRDADDQTPRFGLIVHHTDAEREYAYDRSGHIGRLDQALNEAPQRDWTVVDMKTDWNRIYPAE